MNNQNSQRISDYYNLVPQRNDLKRNLLSANQHVNQIPSIDTHEATDNFASFGVLEGDVRGQTHPGTKYDFLNTEHNNLNSSQISGSTLKTQTDLEKTLRNDIGPILIDNGGYSRIKRNDLRQQLSYSNAQDAQFLNQNRLEYFNEETTGTSNYDLQNSNSNLNKPKNKTVAKYREMEGTSYSRAGGPGYDTSDKSSVSKRAYSKSKRDDSSRDASGQSRQSRSRNSRQSRSVSQKRPQVQQPSRNNYKDQILDIMKANRRQPTVQAPQMKSKQELTGPRSSLGDLTYSKGSNQETEFLPTEAYAIGDSTQFQFPDSEEALDSQIIERLPIQNPIPYYSNLEPQILEIRSESERVNPEKRQLDLKAAELQRIEKEKQLKEVEEQRKELEQYLQEKQKTTNARNFINQAYEAFSEVGKSNKRSNQTSSKTGLRLSDQQLVSDSELEDYQHLDEKARNHLNMPRQIHLNDSKKQLPYQEYDYFDNVTSPVIFNVDNGTNKRSGKLKRDQSSRSRSPVPRDFTQVPLISQKQLSQDFGSTPQLHPLYRQRSSRHSMQRYQKVEHVGEFQRTNSSRQCLKDKLNNMVKAASMNRTKACGVVQQHKKRIQAAEAQDSIGPQRVSGEHSGVVKKLKIKPEIPKQMTKQARKRSSKPLEVRIQRERASRSRTKSRPRSVSLRAKELKQKFETKLKYNVNSTVPHPSYNHSRAHISQKQSQSQMYSNYLEDYQQPMIEKQQTGLNSDLDMMSPIANQNDTTIPDDDQELKFVEFLKNVQLYIQQDEDASPKHREVSQTGPDASSVTISQSYLFKNLQFLREKYKVFECQQQLKGSIKNNVTYNRSTNNGYNGDDNTLILSADVRSGDYPVLLTTVSQDLKMMSSNVRSWASPTTGIQSRDPRVGRVKDQPIKPSNHARSKSIDRVRREKKPEHNQQLEHCEMPERHRKQIEFIDQIYKKVVLNKTEQRNQQKCEQKSLQHKAKKSIQQINEKYMSKDGMDKFDQDQSLQNQTINSTVLNRNYERLVRAPQQQFDQNQNILNQQDIAMLSAQANYDPRFHPDLQHLMNQALIARGPEAISQKASKYSSKSRSPRLSATQDLKALRDKLTLEKSRSLERRAKNREQREAGQRNQKSQAFDPNAHIHLINHAHQPQMDAEAFQMQSTINGTLNATLQSANETQGRYTNNSQTYRTGLSPQTYNEQQIAPSSVEHTSTPTADFSQEFRQVRQSLQYNSMLPANEMVRGSSEKPLENTMTIRPTEQSDQHDLLNQVAKLSQMVGDPSKLSVLQISETLANLTATAQELKRACEGIHDFADVLKSQQNLQLQHLNNEGIDIESQLQQDGHPSVNSSLKGSTFKSQENLGGSGPMDEGIHGLKDTFGVKDSIQRQSTARDTLDHQHPPLLVNQQQVLTKKREKCISLVPNVVLLASPLLDYFVISTAI